MNLMVAPSTSMPSLTPDEQMIHDIWADSGLHVVLRDSAEMQPTMFFLKHLPEELEKNTLNTNLGWSHLRLLRRFMPYLAFGNLKPAQALSFMWLFRSVHSITTQRIFKHALQGDLSTLPLASSFKPGHPAFEEDHAKWKKTAAILALSNFPSPVCQGHLAAAEWLTHLELLRTKYGDSLLLKKMAKAIQSKEARFHRDYYDDTNNKPPKSKLPKQIVEQYEKTKSMQRLRMMRVYYYETDTLDN